MHRIRSEQDIGQGVAALEKACPVIRQVLAATGMPPLRLGAPGFAGLMRIVAGQQLSVAAAGAIWSRLETRIDPMTPDQFAKTRDEDLQACGFSRPKIRTARHVSTAIAEGSLDLDALETMDVDEGIAHMCEVKGIGPWTAEIYMMFCLGHADIWPSGDLALQVALQDAYGLETRPDAPSTIPLVESWRPWRGVAARALWSYYKVCRSPLSGVPL